MSIITDMLSNIETEEETYKCPHCNEDISYVLYGYGFEEYCPCCHKQIS